MFNFIDMAGTYESRKVGNNMVKGSRVSTCLVTDGSKQYETAIRDSLYRGGSLIIVDSYDTHEEAEKGHASWLEKLTNNELPDTLVDCDNSGLAGEKIEYKKGE